MRLFSQDTKVAALKRAPLFEGLTRQELVQLARVSEDIEVPPDKALCKEGDIGQEFFVIVDGEAEVTSKGKHVATRAGGDFVGEISLLLEAPRTATVTARTPMRLFVLTRRDFWQLVSVTPSVQDKVSRALARRLAELTGDPTLA
jgi:CRP/FNR family transcriptional regulator, cyclic AMP receptor protein